MLLYLLRHGDALESGYYDISRPLSLIGEEQAKVTADMLVTFKISVELILSSPLLRAKQMAEIIRKAIGDVEHSVTEYLVPGANERQLFRQLSDCNKRAVLLIGHEPHLRTFASLMIGGSRQSQIEVKKGTLMCLETTMPVKPESGVLKWMLAADQMKQLLAR